MSIDNKNIKKVQQRGKYQKINRELKFQILQELEFHTIKELSKKYGIARQTIASFKNAKEHIYDRFKSEVLTYVYKLVDMRLEGYPSLSEQAMKKEIKFFYKTREYFKYSEMNFLKDFIPDTKRDSQKKRIIQFVVEKSLAYFNQQKQQKLSKGNVVIPQQQQQVVLIQDQSNQQQNSEEFQLKLPVWYVDESSQQYFDLSNSWQIELA